MYKIFSNLNFIVLPKKQCRFIIEKNVIDLKTKNNESLINSHLFCANRMLSFEFHSVLLSCACSFDHFIVDSFHQQNI